MELMTKQGYKQTEVGLIPEDWRVEKFKDVTNAITCGVAATPKYVSESLGMPFLSASHVQKGKVVPNQIKYITKDLYGKITKNNKPEKGDILYTRVGAGIGEAGVIDFDLDFAIYVSLTLIKPKSILYNYYLKSILNSNYYKFLAKNGQFAGGGVQNLNVEVVREFPIPIPSMEEQKAIATALSDVDALITSLEQTITKKKAIKQGAMQQLLTPPHKGGKRLPGFEGEWVEKTLGEFTDLITKGTTPTSLGKQFTSEGINFIKAESINKTGNIINDKVAHIDAETHDLLGRSKMKSKDLLFTIAGVLGRVGIIREENLPANTNQAVAIIRLKKSLSLSTLFFFHVLRTRTIEKHIESISVQGAQANFSLTDVSNIPLTIPASIVEQQAIAQILSDMDAEITQLETKKEKYQAIKQGMMQELLTGKTRLI